ncbi:hypothetical protein BO70DRAFT_355510 [Aspergillus heteromorphus CBS 117.55]|uniref:Rhodopsin domain-containing protein n=1 Tax=Aspergillus heteromorphus CBS 117.55 TaxID=1448321 RepID=A0A317V9D6_9EURO|nr:uncharacterized protein BO70DRAFT_355510 [Aspergillus heteromorphus CBS 117.55]PWY71003.1 hypothetical protein BO70DRAFT_355510 [Aspergillus heteromorphus CBS 117.55]
MGSSFNNSSGLALERGLWAGAAVATVIVTLRIIAKFKIHHFRLDDILMLVALALTIASTVCLTLCVNYGFGSDLTKLDRHDQEGVLKYIAIQVPLVTFSTGIARFSFAYYLIGILGGNKKYMIALWAAGLLQLACNIVSAVLPLSICKDVRILWDASIKTTCGNSTDVVDFSYFSSSNRKNAAVNTTTDLFLAIFPTVIFWNLNLKTSIKISLIGLLSLGVVAMVASIIKTTKLDEVPSVVNLGAGGAVGLIRWGYAENLIIIITSSVPCIRPLLMSSVRKFSSAARSRSYELTGPFSGNKGTSKNATAQSRMREQHTSENQHDDDCDSIEQILKDLHKPQSVLDRGNNTGAGAGGGRGIQKQVEISIVSNQRSGRGFE